MDNLWILTEERPKESVIKSIVKLYTKNYHSEIINETGVKIRPDIDNGHFRFSYTVEGIQVKDIQNIKIITVSGNSSFFDFLLFKQESKPEDGSTDGLLMAIEETKTSDDESRNTGVYQRASKFVFIDAYAKDTKLYMLYNDELECREDKEPSDTSKFGTNMLLTIDVTILGKDITKWFSPFRSIDDLLLFKSKMHKPPARNVPIELTKYDDRIEVSGRLSKPADAGNIGHDPNIGALSIISKTLRYLGWGKRIVITKHGVSQKYIDKSRGDKFLFICKILGIELDGLVIPEQKLPDKYWHYEAKSEKIASILLHMAGEYYGLRGIYQNHAGCERGYFKTIKNELITLPKKDKSGENLYIPDLVLHDPVSNDILLIEGKKLTTLNAGLEEIEDYDSIENEFIKPYYRNSDIYRYVSIFGGNLTFLPDRKVLLYLSDNGTIIINPEAPEFIKTVFRKFGVAT